MRAAGAVLPRAALALGFNPAGLEGALARLGCTADVEGLRAARRRELAGRATLSERARLAIADPERLQDLGLLAQFEGELRERLPEHIRALGRSREPLALALARSLSLPARGVRELATRLGLDLGPITSAETLAGNLPPPRFRAEQLDRAPRAERRPRPTGERSSVDDPSRKAGAARPSRPAGPRPGGSARPSRPGGSARPSRPGGSARPSRPGRPSPRRRRSPFPPGQPSPRRRRSPFPPGRPAPGRLRSPFPPGRPAPGRLRSPFPPFPPGRPASGRLRYAPPAAAAMNSTTPDLP